ncbi:DUF1834 family protein [Chromobacterium vaccinii]|uniref:DUF1834 family protein n=1 Tax=Chromobacterium vaccinii TaxID=1108595 RepID=UPI003C72F02F
MSAPAVVPIITAVELAMVQRLRAGLGRMVTSVETYGGEFDEDNLAEVVRRMPAAWVTFAGIRATAPAGTSREKWRTEGSFVVMVGARSVRSEASSRHGGVDAREVGTNLLIATVRRLLTQQDLGLPIRELAPGSVRTLYNSRLQTVAFSVFACEFGTAWVEDALRCGEYPQTGAGASGIDALIQQYAGQTQPADPDWAATTVNYYLDPAAESGAPDAQDIVKTGGPI